MTVAPLSCVRRPQIRVLSAAMTIEPARTPQPPVSR